MTGPAAARRGAAGREKPPGGAEVRVRCPARYSASGVWSMR